MIPYGSEYWNQARSLNRLFLKVKKMPKFLDAHSLKGTDEETLKKLQHAPADEFGIKHVNLMYNQEEDRFFCLTEAPNKDAVENHHSKHGFNCEWITEVKTTA
jgi:hypothetical protein